MIKLNYRKVSFEMDFRAGVEDTGKRTGKIFIHKEDEQPMTQSEHRRTSTPSRGPMATLYEIFLSKI